MRVCMCMWMRMCSCMCVCLCLSTCMYASVLCVYHVVRCLHSCTRRARLPNITHPAGARSVQLKSWNAWSTHDNNSVRIALLMEAVQQVPTHTHRNTHTHTRTRIHTHRDTHRHTHRHTHTHTYTHTDTHPPTHTHILGTDG